MSLIRSPVACACSSVGWPETRDVRRHRVQVARQAPHMQVVNVDHVGTSRTAASTASGSIALGVDSSNTSALRCSKPHGLAADGHAHQQRHRRVKPVGAVAEHDDETGRGDRERHSRIGDQCSVAADMFRSARAPGRTAFVHQRRADPVQRRRRRARRSPRCRRARAVDARAGATASTATNPVTASSSPPFASAARIVAR